MSRFFKSFLNAVNGLRWATSGQLNLKIHFIMAAAVIVAGFFFQMTELEWLVIALTIGMVIAAELINTAIEKMVDLVSPGQHPLAGKIKDIAAAAVLISAITAVVIGMIIFGKYL